MDWVRTQFILATFIIIMIYFLVSFFLRKAKESFDLPKNKKTNMDGLKKVNDPDRYWLLGGPLKNDVGSTEECSRICKNQTECAGKNAECTPSYNSQKQCYCSFKITEGFDQIFDPLPNTVPVWKYTKEDDHHIWKPTTKQQLGVWSDTGIKDMNDMTISFWVTVKNTPFPEQFMPIIQVTKPGYTLDSTLPWQWNDRYIGIWVYQNNDTYCSLVFANMSTDAVSPGAFIRLDYDEPFFIVISNKSDKNTDVFVNGIKQDFPFILRTGELKVPETNANILMRKSFDSILIKELQMYNGVFTEQTSKLIYEEIKIRNTLPNTMRFQGQGCCRFNGWNAANKEYKTIAQCKTECLNDPKCVAADMARPNGQNYQCFHFYETIPGGSAIIDTKQCGNSDDPSNMCYKK